MVQPIQRKRKHTHVRPSLPASRRNKGFLLLLLTCKHTARVAAPCWSRPRGRNLLAIRDPLRGFQRRRPRFWACELTWVDKRSSRLVTVLQVQGIQSFFLDFAGCDTCGLHRQPRISFFFSFSWCCAQGGRFGPVQTRHGHDQTNSPWASGRACTGQSEEKSGTRHSRVTSVAVNGCGEI